MNRMEIMQQNPQQMKMMSFEQRLDDSMGATFGDDFNGVLFQRQYKIDIFGKLDDKEIKSMFESLGNEGIKFVIEMKANISKSPDLPLSEFRKLKDSTGSI